MRFDGTLNWYYEALFKGPSSAWPLNVGFFAVSSKVVRDDQNFIESLSVEIELKVFIFISRIP